MIYEEPIILVIKADHKFLKFVQPRFQGSLLPISSERAREKETLVVACSRLSDSRVRGD